MKNTAKACGPQGSNRKTRTQNVAHSAHSAHYTRARDHVGQRTKPQTELSPIRRKRGCKSPETHTAPKNWIPASITASEGRNDKLHISCQIATVVCDTKDDVRSFVLHCGAAPLKQRNEHEFFSKLFTTAPLNGDGSKLEARSTLMECGGEILRPPLFAGRLKFRRMTRNDGKIAVFVTADLFLNVNRALNHRRAELVMGGQDAILTTSAAIKRGCCGGDNLAPFDLEPDEHDHARKMHLKTTMAAILADLKRAAECAEDAGSEGVRVIGYPADFSLREVETCWDIGGVGFDAFQALADITPALREHGGKRGWEGNAGTVTIEFSKWERLVVYAKAPDRLRFEIRHFPTKGNRPYCSSDLAETIGKLNGFRDLAATKVNGLLASLSNRLAASRTESEWEAYAMAWGACCGNSDASKALFKILRQNGRIQGGKCVECIADSEKLLRNARKADLIENSCGAFRPIFSNEPMLSLTHLDNSASFLGHRTETQTVVSVPNSPTPIRKRSGQVGVPPCPPFLIQGAVGPIL